MVTIATFDNAANARRLKERYQEAGLHADVLTEGQMQQVASLAKPEANIRVMVEEDDFDRANQLLAEWEASDPAIGSPIRCPQCRSPRIDYPQLARKFPFIPGLAAILLAIGVFPKEFYCQDCHYTWVNTEPQPRYRFWNRLFSGPTPRQS